MRLQEELPGSQAQKHLAPVNRILQDPQELRPGEYKPSAVMILLCSNHQRELFFPLIKRIDYEGVHGGQISLPGGKKEETDTSLEETALRECSEEIGMEGKIQLLGKLSPLYIPVSGYLVQPFVSFLENPEPSFVPQPSEVQKIFSIPIKDLLDDKNLNRGKIKVRNYSIDTPYFSLENQQVWGATAMILNEMKTVLRTIY